MTGVDIVDIKAFHDLDAVAADAAGALDRAAQSRLFDRLDWCRLTLAHAAPPGRLFALRAAADEARAWLFLMIDGREATALASWYTLRLDTPAIGDSAACLDALANELARRRLARIVLTPLADEAIAAAFRRTGWRVGWSPITSNWTAAVTDWPSYWAARPAPLRETVRRKGRGTPFRIKIITTFDPTAWQDYETVYAQSWKPAEGSPAFLRALAEQEGAAGTLRLGLAYDADRPVAAQFWLVENDVATIHKLAHVEADRARSPGTLLSHAMFRHAIEVDRVRTIDFGAGDDAYKADWMDIRTPLYRLDAWNPRHPRGLALYLRHRAGQLVHRLRSR